MSKRDLALSSSPDVTYDTDEDGTKVIIRKFDIPLPARNGGKMSEKKWKYQHDVPEGKIYTKRIHADLSTVRNPKCIGTTASNPSSSPISKVLPPKMQNTQVLKAPVHNDIVMSPNKQIPKLFTAVPKSLCSEKITLNNLPENVIKNSITVIDSKYVNGKKVFYLKAFKDANKPVSKPVTSGAEVILSQSGKQMMCITGTGATMGAVSTSNLNTSNLNTSNLNTSSLNTSDTRRVYRSARAVQNVEEVGPTVHEGTSSKLVSASKLRSALAQKLQITSREVPMSKTAILTRSTGLKKTDAQTNMPIALVVPGLVPFSNSQVSSVPSQNNKELKTRTIYVAEPLSRMGSGILGSSSVTRDVVTNNCREITVQINQTTKPKSHILIDSSKNNINVAESNISVVGLEVLNSASDTGSFSDCVLRVNDQSIIKEDNLSFVPADSTTPYIVNSTSTSMNQKMSNKNSSETVLVMSQEDMDKNKSEKIGNVSQNTGGVYCTEPKIISNSERSSPVPNLVVLNPKLNSASSNVTAIPQPNLNEYMRRRKIALQFQHDMQKNRDLPRLERTIERPAKVRIVDSSTQTTLFCMLEPGRMVEMFVNKDSDDSTSKKPMVNQGTHCETGPTKEWTSTSSERNTEMTRGISTAQPKTATNIETATNNTTGPPLSKRIRLEMSNPDTEIIKERQQTCLNIVNETPFLHTVMDFQDVIAPQFESIEKENIKSANTKTASKSYKNGERDVQNNHNNINNINSVHLACRRSTLNSKANYDDRNLNNFDKIKKVFSNKQIVAKLRKDYQNCLVQDDDGNLPIHNAVMDRNVIEVLRQCLVLAGQKHSVDVKNSMKETPLHLAVLCHDLQIVSVLLKQNAQSDVADSEGNTAVHMAIIWGKNTDILKVLLDSVDNSETLNIPNDEGYSPLHLCAIHNKCSEAAMLVKKNADINIRDRKSGRTPLFHAVENGNSEISRTLINCGASTTISNFSGQTPLTASEVTFVLDKLSKNADCSKSIVAACPCPCQSATEEDGEHVSHSESLGEGIEDLCSNIDMHDDFNLETVFIVNDR